MMNPFASPPISGPDGFVAKLNTVGALSYSSYLSGKGTTRGLGIAAAQGGTSAYIAGYTASPDFPTVNHFHPHAGGEDAILARITAGAPPPVASIVPHSDAQGTTIEVILTGSNFVSGSTTVQVSGTGVR